MKWNQKFFIENDSKKSKLFFSIETAVALSAYDDEAKTKDSIIETTVISYLERLI